jgi:hypothetical protein
MPGAQNLPSEAYLGGTPQRRRGSATPPLDFLRSHLAWQRQPFSYSPDVGGPGAEAISPMMGFLRLNRARLLKKRGGKKEKSIAIPAITGY